MRNREKKKGGGGVRGFSVRRAGQRSEGTDAINDQDSIQQCGGEATCWDRAVRLK